MHSWQRGGIEYILTMLNMIFVLFSIQSIVFAIICLSQTVVIANSYTFPITELNALQDLYNSTSGSSWQWKQPASTHGNPWNFSEISPNPCQNNWQGVNCSTDCISSPCYVVDLFLENLNLNGTLPNSISRLPKLQSLILNVNHIVGTIPFAIGSLSNLIYLRLGANQLTGTIPVSIGQLTSLQSISLKLNKLNGTIPSILGQLSQLQALEVNINNLSGTMPSSIGNLVNLTVFSSGMNALSGTIPTQFSRLTQLQYFELFDNFFSGTLPSFVGNLSTLVSIAVNGNKFSGTIPASLSNLSNLRNLFLYNNHFNGTIPRFLAFLPKLRYLYLNSNNFTGTVPSELGVSDALEHIYLGNNYLVGTLPVNLFINPNSNLSQFSVPSNFLTGKIELIKDQLNTITLLDLQFNMFSGTIPPLMLLPNLNQLQLQGNLLHGQVHFDLPALINMDISDNFLHGCFPWNSLSASIQYINISYNQFSCSIPNDVFTLPYYSLLSVDVSHNQMTGTLADRFARFGNLSTLMLSNNMFQGDLYSLIDAYEQPRLSYIEITYNLLTGTVPSSLFMPRLISSVVLTGNCLTGALPDNVCSASKLTTLVLDGMGSNSACNNPLFGGAGEKKIYRLSLQHPSTLPACIFSDLPLLHTLHLSGLGMVGTLPDRTPETLSHLSLSYNYLTGTIPKSFYNYRHWDELDVSFNRISGIPAEFSSINGSLNMRINRFSGNLPISIVRMKDINILSGNMFYCTPFSMATDELPINDPDFLSYQCGSNDMNMVLAIWAGGVFVFLAFAYMVPRFIRSRKFWWVWNQDSTKFDISNANFIPSIVEFLDVSKQWLNASIVIAMFCLFGLLPLYVILKIFYPTYEVQYAWTASANFLRGVSPALILLLTFSFVLIYYTKQAYSHGGSEPVLLDPTMRPSFHRDSQIKKRKIIHFISQVLVSGFVVIVINMLYVFALNQDIGFQFLVPLIIALSMFKILSNFVLLETSTVSSETTTYVIIGLLCFNNVIVPYLAESIVSTNCFYYATLRPAPEVSSIINTKHCRLIFNPDAFDISSLLPEEYAVCTPTEQTITYQPPFIYSYTCSSSLIANFATVFVFRYLMTGAILPAIRIAIDIYLRYSNNPEGSFYKLLEKLEIQRWKLIRKLEMRVEKSGDVDREILEHIEPRRVFDHRRFALLLVSDMVLLLTFGVLFPPLAAIVLISISIHVSDNVLGVVRIVNLSSRNNSYWRHFLKQLEEELASTKDMIIRPVPYLAFVTALFWSLTLFDILGDVVGAVHASWIVVLMCLSPLFWCYLWQKYYHYKLIQSAQKPIDFGIDDCISDHETTVNPIARAISTTTEGIELSTNLSRSMDNDKIQHQ